MEQVEKRDARLLKRIRAYSYCQEMNEEQIDRLYTALKEIRDGIRAGSMHMMAADEILHDAGFEPDYLDILI